MTRNLKLHIILCLFCILFLGLQNNCFAYISVDSGDMAQAIVDAITDNASIFQQNNQTNASNSISYYEQAIENIDKVELSTAINKFLDKIQTASGDISFNDISMYVYIQNSSYTSYPLQLRIIYSSFNSDSDVSRYTIYASNDGTGFEIAPYDTNKGFLYQDIQITPQGKVYGLSWSSFTPLIRKTSIYQYRFPAVSNVNIEERTGGLYYKPLISFGTSQFVTLNNGADIYGLNLNKLNFSDTGGITPTPTPSGDTPSGDTPSGDTPSGDIIVPSGTITNTSGEVTGNVDLSGIENGISDINNSLTSTDASNINMSGESDFLFNNDYEVEDPSANFFTWLLTQIQTIFLSNQSVETITVNFREENIVIRSDFFTLPNGVLKTFLQAYYYYFVGLFIIKDIRKMVEQLKNGNIEQISNEDINANMV